MCVELIDAPNGDEFVLALWCTNMWSRLIVLFLVTVAARPRPSPVPTDHADFTSQLFEESAATFERDQPQPRLYYLHDDDLVWRNDPRQWHQQLARIVDHRFLSFEALEAFAVQAKQAGVSALMLVQVQKSAACPGGWYNRLQLCDHINGSFPAAGGTAERWQKMVAAIRPMRLMWWMNPTYWSVQGEVWAQAKAAKFSDVGQFFSWNATEQDRCFGSNPDGGDGVRAQGSWGSEGIGQGFDSALASFGSESYADYMVDALANSWTRNLGIEGYTIDCSANYGKSQQCPSGMLQCHGDAQGTWGRDIVARVRALQPQVVLSGEAFGSWQEVIRSNSDVRAHRVTTV